MSAYSGSGAVKSASSPQNELFSLKTELEEHIISGIVACTTGNVGISALFDSLR